MSELFDLIDTLRHFIEADAEQQKYLILDRQEVRVLLGEIDRLRGSKTQ